MNKKNSASKLEQKTKTKVSPPVPNNVFIGNTEEPTEGQLAHALGAAKIAWDQLLTDLSEQNGVTTHHWKCYSSKSGWSLRALRGKRTILWLSPRVGCFGVTFIFGDRAMSAIRESQFPKRVVQAIDDAQKYPEGTGVRLEVKKLSEINAIKKLALIKIEN